MTDCAMMMLKDDCLLSIFSFLTNWTDKVRMEFVCRRFARLGSRYSWRGIDRLEIKLDVDDWNDEEDVDQFFCTINDTKLPLLNLSFALHSLLLRIDDNIQGLTLHLRSCFDNEAGGHDKRIAFDNSFASIFPVMASHQAKFKLVTFSYTGNIAELNTIVSLIKPSSASLNNFQFHPSMEPLTLYDLFGKGFYPEVWECVSSCSALEQFSIDTDRLFICDFIPCFRSSTVLGYLANKPLRRLHVGYPNNFSLHQWITDDQYAKVCNEVSGQGISHLGTRKLADFGGFITRLNDRARKAMVELKCECDIANVLPVLPSIGEMLPNVRRLTVESVDPDVPSEMLPNAVIGLFHGLDSESDRSGHQIEISYLVLGDHKVEDDFKRALTAACRASGVTVSFGDHVSTPWVIFEKENAKFIVHEVEC